MFPSRDVGLFPSTSKVPFFVHCIESRRTEDTLVEDDTEYFGHSVLFWLWTVEGIVGGLYGVMKHDRKLEP